ncbi:hypothetical protein CDL15_Pgr028619 [Punica granatum]|nr:hypothetical protein CDL15_Pgr028619 [Punica granatum]
MIKALGARQAYPWPRGSTSNSLTKVARRASLGPRGSMNPLDTRDSVSLCRSKWLNEPPSVQVARWASLSPNGLASHLYPGGLANHPISEARQDSTLAQECVSR